MVTVKAGLVLILSSGLIRHLGTRSAGSKGSNNKQLGPPQSSYKPLKMA